MTATRTICTLLAGAVLFCGGAYAGEDAGVIKGKTTYKGGSEALKPEHVRRNQDTLTDKNCTTKVGTNPANVVQKLADGAGLKWVLVSIKHDFGDRKWPVPEAPAVLDQKGCEYHPHVLGMMAGQKLEARNGDSFTHNVHGLPKKNGEFNDSQTGLGKKNAYTLAHPEVFFVKCDVHSWMGAWVGVFPHPFFAVTDQKGEFEIKNVPAGEYTVEFWHPTFGTQTKQVKVGAEPAVADAEFEAK